VKQGAATKSSRLLSSSLQSFWTEIIPWRPQRRPFCAAQHSQIDISFSVVIVVPEFKTEF
jgi:hypothetical protein